MVILERKNQLELKIHKKQRKKNRSVNKKGSFVNIMQFYVKWMKTTNNSTIGIQNFFLVTTSFQYITPNTQILMLQMMKLNNFSLPMGTSSYRDPFSSLLLYYHQVTQKYPKGQILCFCQRRLPERGFQEEGNWNLISQLCLGNQT